MPGHLPFQLRNFEAYCHSLHRVGIDPGYVMYTNTHASNHKPAARVISACHLEAAQAHISSPSDQTFMQLVQIGALFDNEWDRNTGRWHIIAFEGWEVLHLAFSHQHAKAAESFTDMTGGISDLELVPA